MTDHKYLTNVDCMSALLDRLAIEQLKLREFQIDTQPQAVRHQELIVYAIRDRVSSIIVRTLRRGEYSHLPGTRKHEETLSQGAVNEQ